MISAYIIFREILELKYLKCLLWLNGRVQIRLNWFVKKLNQKFSYVPISQSSFLFRVYSQTNYMYYFINNSPVVFTKILKKVSENMKQWKSNFTSFVYRIIPICKQKKAVYLATQSSEKQITKLSLQTTIFTSEFWTDLLLLF